MDLFVVIKKIFKEKCINLVWIYDGWIMVKIYIGKKWIIIWFIDIDKLKEFICSE